MIQLLTAAFYLALALGALLATRRSRDRRMLGFGLVGAWVASNLIWLLLPIEYRPLLFPLIDVVFGLIAAGVWLSTRSFVPLVLIALSAMAAAMNVVFSLTASPGLAQINTYEIVLNIIFAAQCIITTAWGLLSAVSWSDRVGGVAGSARRPAQHTRSSHDNEGG